VLGLTRKWVAAALQGAAALNLPLQVAEGPKTCSLALFSLCRDACILDVNNCIFFSSFQALEVYQDCNKKCFVSRALG
jgi:hypothetical protein